ncbi:MAG: hypothetical protein QNK23_05215 [Crocinitomicaceae bacterium]|nr:hypothetical protein [Crocinitomicaceae bacterium]
MNISLLLLSVFTFCTISVGQNNEPEFNSDSLKIVKNSDSSGQRRLTYFDFSEQISLCIDSKHKRPVDLRCFQEEIRVKGDVTYLKIQVNSMHIDPGSTELLFIGDRTSDFLDYQINSVSNTLIRYDKKKNILTQIEYTQDTVTNSLLTNEIRLNNYSEGDPTAYNKDSTICLSDDCSSYISYTYWDNGKLRFQQSKYIKNDGVYTSMEKFDSLGSEVLNLRCKNDSILFSYYSEYLPGTELISTMGSISSINPLKKEIDLLFEYQFDSIGNWKQRKTFRNDQLMEAIEREIKYGSEYTRIKLHIGGLTFEPYESNDPCSKQFIERIEFQDYSVMIDTKKNIVFAINKKGRILWKIKAKKIFEHTVEQKLCNSVHYFGLTNLEYYDLVLQTNTAPSSLINSRNGSMLPRQ